RLAGAERSAAKASTAATSGGGREERSPSASLATKRMAIKVLWPFPSPEVKEFMASCDKVFVVENNFSGQLAGLIKREIGGHDKIEPVLKYDGTPFRPADIVKGIQEAL
ncbi:MAG TPA: hypothetical protein VM582_00745, partial [Candidatus Thermoplasmatota archaeon]|nr:hypothetical protein [Candidatus Thermoplasmatota archaeon]